MKSAILMFASLIAIFFAAQMSAGAPETQPETQIWFAGGVLSTDTAAKPVLPDSMPFLP